MPRIVIDNNAFISFLFWQNSVPARAVDLAIERYEVISSEQTIDELRNTIQKEKFSRYGSVEERLSRYEDIRALVKIIPVTECVTDCRHPPDNKFLELAASGGADIILTGDKDLLVLHPWRGVAILSPQQFLTISQS